MTKENLRQGAIVTATTIAVHHAVHRAQRIATAGRRVATETTKMPITTTTTGHSTNAITTMKTAIGIVAR